MTKEELIALAKKPGIDLTEADFAQPAGELDNDELDAVDVRVPARAQISDFR